MSQIVSQKCGFHETISVVPTTTTISPTTQSNNEMCLLRISTLEGNLRTLTEDKDNCQTEVSTYLMQIANLEAELSTAKSAKTLAETSHSNLQQAFNVLDEQLKKNKNTAMECDATIASKLLEISELLTNISRKDQEINDQNIKIKNYKSKLELIANNQFWRIAISPEYWVMIYVCLCFITQNNKIIKFNQIISDSGWKFFLLTTKHAVRKATYHLHILITTDQTRFFQA